MMEKREYFPTQIMNIICSISDFAFHVTFPAELIKVVLSKFKRLSWSITPLMCVWSTLLLKLHTTSVHTFAFISTRNDLFFQLTVCYLASESKKRVLFRLHWRELNLINCWTIPEEFNLLQIASVHRLII